MASVSAVTERVMQGSMMRVAAMVAAPLMLSGCQHAVVGNSIVLGMALCLFFGTLQLGRRPAPVRDDARGAASQPRS
jgi:hypothetical protein